MRDAFAQLKFATTLRRAILLLGFVTGRLLAQHVASPTSPQPPADSSYSARRLDLTLVDLPYNASHGGRAPSMAQSLDLTVSAYEVIHGSIARAFHRSRTLGVASTILFDLFSTVELSLPLTDVWIHEEFHRAQMGRRGIGSYDDVYALRPNSAVIAVSHVRDEDLIAFKRDHVAELIRMNAAGIEGELLLVRALEHRQFTGQGMGSHTFLYCLAKLSTAGYVASSTWDDVDADTDEMNRDDGADVARRDFTGHDFLAWTHDLHRPTEPYIARGVHPSGVGVDRYIKLADLTADERNFIRNEGKLRFSTLSIRFSSAYPAFTFAVRGGSHYG